MSAPVADVAWFTVLTGGIQFLTAIVIGLVCYIIKGIITSHKELADKFEEFALAYAKVSSNPRNLENLHIRIGEMEHTILVMGTELHGKGHISEMPKIAQGIGWR